MMNFGELVNADVPVLLDFYENDEPTGIASTSVLKKLASKLRGRAKVFKLEMAKNQTLVKALKVKKQPTFMIYKDGEEVWRASGESEVAFLLQKLEECS